MIIMGVDPGSRVTGYGLITLEGNQIRCLDFGAVRAASSSESGIPQRLKVVFESLERLVEKFAPQAMAVEGVFYAANAKSALTLGHVRGVVLLVAARYGLSTVEFSPLEIKKAVVGYGRADKQQVQTMVTRLLGLKKVPEPHDAADALAVALCHAFNGCVGRRSQRRWRASELVAPKGSRRKPAVRFSGGHEQI